MNLIAKKPENKMKELILYVCKKSKDDSKFGATKFNKILFYSELIAYRMTGKPITTARYQNQRNGPVPRCWPPLKDEMQTLDELDIEFVEYHGRTQHRYIAKREPNLDVFSSDEKKAIDMVLSALKDKNGTECSDFSHDFIGWQLTERGEDIPLGLALIGIADDLSQEELEYAKSLEGAADSWATVTM